MIPSPDSYNTAADVALFHARDAEAHGEYREAVNCYRFAAVCYHRTATEARAAGDYAHAAQAEYAAHEAAASAVRMSSAAGGAA